MSFKNKLVIKPLSRKKLDKIDGDVKIGRWATIIAANGTITINGKIKNKGGFKCIGNLIAFELEAKKGSVKIFGDLDVKREVSVDAKLIVEGNLKAESVACGLRLNVNGNTKSENISCGLRANLKGIVEAKSISVGGKATLKSNSKVDDISAGRKIDLIGPAIIKNANAGSKIICAGLESKINNVNAGYAIITKKPIEIEKANAGYQLKFCESAKIGFGNAGYRILAKNDFSFEKLNAGWGLIFHKDASGNSLNAGYKISSNSNLIANGDINAGFKITANKNLEANKITAGKKIKAKLIKANTIEVPKRGRLIGVVKAINVLLKERARAKNLYVSKLEMYERSVARNVYAERIKIENHAKLKGKVQYTDTIDAEPKARIRTKPQKVKALPDIDL